MVLQPRPPVVTILGHIDHGKTTLLDFIRKSSVAAKEHGGITQAIGAYQTEHEGKVITFIDTPGHAAFEKMRARGAALADIAVLVVALDDGVMPQTIEAIKHIQKAQVLMVVAINKIDLPGIDIKIQIERIKKQLADQEVVIEEYGGDVPLTLVSAKDGQGVGDLLTTINLLAEVHELKGNSEKLAEGVVIESRLDKFKGPVASVLIRDGSLDKGDLIVAGGIKGRVKGMLDFKGQPIIKVGPSAPVEVLGFESVPDVGSKLGEQTDKKELKIVGATGLIGKLRESKEKVLSVVIKADKEGSLEAIKTVLEEFNKEEEHVRIIFAGTGDIVDSDMELADTTSGIVLGFNVKVVPTAAKFAERERVLVRVYNVIYELIDEVGEVVEGMLKPGRVEEVFGRAQIIAEFPFGKGEKVAGCRILEGTISKGPKARIIRGGETVGEARIKSLRKVKEEINKVEKGMECGMIFDPAVDFQIGDLVESFRTF